MQSHISEAAGWKTEPLLTGPGSIPDVSVSVSSALLACHWWVSVTLPWCFMELCGLPSNTNQDAGSSGSKYRRRVAVPEGATLEPGASSVPRWQKSGRSRGIIAKPHKKPPGMCLCEEDFKDQEFSGGVGHLVIPVSLDKRNDIYPTKPTLYSEEALMIGYEQQWNM